MGNRRGKWKFQIEQLKEMIVPNSDGRGDIAQLRQYLSGLSEREVQELEALIYFGEHGVDYLHVAVDEFVKGAGEDPKERVIDNICSKSTNLEKRIKCIEIIMNGL